MRALLLLLMLLPLASWAAPSPGETGYVTDHLLLGLFEGERASGKRIKTLDSGTPLKVLKRDGGFLYVETPDGGKGWVKGHFVDEDRPAAARLAQLRERHRALKEELQSLKAKVRSLREASERARGKQATAEQELERLREAREQLKARNQELASRLAQKEQALADAQAPPAATAQKRQAAGPLTAALAYAHLLPEPRWAWPLLLLLLVFVLGIVGGWRLYDRRIRRRFHGYRIGC